MSTITASWLILAVIVLRFVLKKAPKFLLCALWALVAVRLICPFSFESTFSLIPSAETVPQEIIYSQSPKITSGIQALNSAVNPVLSNSFTPSAGASTNPLQVWTVIASIVWLIGLAFMLVNALVSFLKIKKRVHEAAPLRDNVWICDHIDTPFILGVFRPRVYLPSAMEKDQSDYVLTHENAHLKRRDHLWKPLGFLLLSVYWFNPLCWLAYWLLCKDIELACDEKVIHDLDAHNKKAYSEALLSCSVPRRMIAACPLAFGEVGVKERIKTVLNYKKPAFWIIVAAVVACVVVAVCFLTNPASPPVSFGGIQIAWAKALDMRPNEPTTRDLDRAQLEELKSRLIDLSVGRKDSDFGGFTPMYSLSIYAQNIAAQFAIISYDVDGNKLALYYENEYYRIDDAQFGRYLGAVCAGEDAASAEERTLTLNDVIALSDKGEALTWSDFDGYSYIETGSGLYIRVYEIDERFSLWIGGGPTDESPLYIRLVSEANHDEYIDIRTESVAGFVEKHGAGSVSTVGGVDEPSLAYETAYAWANYSEDGYNAMVEQAENRDTERRYGNVSHLTPVVKLDSKADYEAFYDEMSAYFDFTQGYVEVSAFSAQAGRYTEDFFTENTLFIAYLEETSASYRHEVEYARVENGVFEIGIHLIAPSEADTAMAGWFMSVAVPKATIADCSGYDAYICVTSDPSNVFPSGELVRTYSFEGDDMMHIAAVSLYDSGEFIFTFSPLSSYIGHGTYTTDSDRLTLKTDDGNYTYVFDMADDTLVFDAAASSGAVWYSGLVDGSELKMSQMAAGYTDLETAIHAAIISENQSGLPDGLLHCESHVVLEQETISATPLAGETDHKVQTFVYALVLYQEYGFSDGAFDLISGSHIPTVMTFDVSADGEYTLCEYWQPRDGSLYAPDIREKFPTSVAEDAIDTQKYILAQKQNCYAQAVEFFNMDTDAVIEGLFESICSSPATSSNPGDYIGEHPLEYRELTYYGDYTLRYVFSEFLKDGQTDLRGHIMRSVMDDLIGDEALKLAANTGQEYFDAWRANAERIYTESGAAFMRENMPKAWLLLQMTD